MYIYRYDDNNINFMNEYTGIRQNLENILNMARNISEKNTNGLGINAKVTKT